jgi:ribonucleoside-triphosphate reductase
MNPSNKLLSDLIAFRTYAKYIPHLQRRETFEETVNRCMIMHLEKFPNLSRDITKAFTSVHDLKVMPSMRSMQFAGPAIVKNNLRQYNCSFVHISHPRVFAEILFLLLSGTGVGFSVQKRHINQLPKVGAPREEGIFFIQDSILGWAQAIHALTDAYFYNAIRPLFNYSNIRAKGSLLVTTGAKAPGPDALRHALEEVEKRLKAAQGRHLKSIEVHDIVCIISDCVLSGGIRRSSLISLFDRNDQEMLKCKSGAWYNEHPYRARANNSALLPRQGVSKEEFLHIFNICKESNAGEPGFAWSNNLEMGGNPCFEVSLYSNQLCNLTTVNQTNIKDKRDYLNRVYNAALIGTLQAAYTDFPYVSQDWQTVTEREALLGVSFTGIADSGAQVTNEWLEDGARLVLEVNEKYAKKLGINLAARATVNKPEGTASCLLASSSGIHDRHSQWYLRRFQISKDDTLYLYLKNVIPELVEDYKMAPNTAVITIPQESPPGALLRDDTTALQLFNRAMRYNKHWIAPGHRTGDNKNNVSCTISVKDNEWDDLADSMWDNRKLYSGISLIPFDLGVYEQTPFESCTKERFDEFSKYVKNINFKDVKEIENNTSMMESSACAGGACEITYLK